jgi:ribosomal protein S18 acetylase RimI-like enzyme
MTMTTTTTTPLTLRAPAAADIPALADLGRSSFLAKFGHLYRADDLLPFLEDMHSPMAVTREMDSPDRCYCLAERDARLVGYCKLGLASGFPEHARGRKPIEIKQLYTAPDATGGGIGAAMMDWALDAAHQFGADEIQLSVWNQNFGAQRFYARYGFEKVADIGYWVGQQRDEEFLFSLML